MNPTRLRNTILGIGVAGALLFAAAFTISFVQPLVVERLAREVVRQEVEQRVGARVDALTEARMIGLARSTLAGTDADIDAARRWIEAGIPQAVASRLADWLDADCDCRGRLVAAAQADALRTLSALERGRDQLTGFIDAAYRDVANHLLREFRIFTAANALVFLLLAGVTLARGQSARALVLPTVVLLGAAAITASLYLFGQDWLHTILFGDYVGLAYFAYLALAIALLADVAFNRARVGLWLLDAAATSVTAAPC